MWIINEATLEEFTTYVLPILRRIVNCNITTAVLEQPSVIPQIKLNESEHPTPYTPNPSTECSQTASGIVYQSHQEMLNRNRLRVARPGHYLTPDCRGTSYPPPRAVQQGGATAKRGGFSVVPPSISTQDGSREQSIESPVR